MRTVTETLLKMLLRYDFKVEENIKKDIKNSRLADWLFGWKRAINCLRI